MTDASPNLIERLENLIAALDNARANAESEYTRATLECIDDAAGIAGEILTMVDGR